MAQPFLRISNALILVVILWKLQLHTVGSETEVWNTRKREDHSHQLESSNMKSRYQRSSCPVGHKRKAGTSSLTCHNTSLKCVLRDPPSLSITTMAPPEIDSSRAFMSDSSSPASVPTMSTEKGRLTKSLFTAQEKETITHTDSGDTQLAKPPEHYASTAPNKSSNRHDSVTTDRSVERTGPVENTATVHTTAYTDAKFLTSVKTIKREQFTVVHIHTTLFRSGNTQGAKSSTHDKKSTTISSYSNENYALATTDGTVKRNNRVNDTATSGKSEASSQIRIGSTVGVIIAVLILVCIAIYRKLGCRPFFCVGQHNAVVNTLDTEENGINEEETML